jgi:glucose-6-phosphate 1-dehydrogenase
MAEKVSGTKTHDQLEPTVFVIFGGAGDLTWRKLVPALFDLSQDRSHLAQFAIIAMGCIKLVDDVLRSLRWVEVDASLRIIRLIRIYSR